MSFGHSRRHRPVHLPRAYRAGDEYKPRRTALHRINHEEAYSLDGDCTNWAEEFFSRIRRAEIGHHHRIAGAYLLRYAQEDILAGRQSSHQVHTIAALAMKRGSILGMK